MTFRGNPADPIRLHDCGRFHRESEPCPDLSVPDLPTARIALYGEMMQMLQEWGHLIGVDGDSGTANVAMQAVDLAIKQGWRPSPAASGPKDGA